jgi:hypothetical protein
MSDVGDVHNSGDVIARVTKILLEHVLHYISPEVADVCEVIDGRAAGINCYLALLARLELIARPCK